VELVGVAIHELRLVGTGTISAEGFPPDHAPNLVAIEDYEVDFNCAQRGGDRVELLIGLRASTEDGGGWLGADVTYTVGEQTYVLEIRNEMLICGPVIPELCDEGADASAVGQGQPSGHPRGASACSVTETPTRSGTETMLTGRGPDPTRTEQLALPAVW
jgi:hypothetical protein